MTVAAISLGAYSPPESRIKLTAQEHRRIVEMLEDPYQHPPADIDDAWFDCSQRRPHDYPSGGMWTAHHAVIILAEACNIMGLRSTDIFQAIHHQRDTMLRESRGVARLRDEKRAIEITTFLEHRGDGDPTINRKLADAWKADKAWSVFCAVRTLAVMAMQEPLTTVDLHECIRRVRDRTAGTGGEAGSIWMPPEFDIGPLPKA